MRFLRTLCLLLLLPVSAGAQERPVAASTVTTTSTSTSSVCVGCAVGSTTATGGIKAGPVDVSSVTSAGYVEIANNVPGATTNRLYNNGGTLTWAGSALALGGAVGPGTLGKLAKFTGANSIGDSICSESGTTLSCVNTVSATTLTGTLSTASQTAITGVGTITTGTWSATVIGLSKGGTGVDLSGTGGTSQFLRQNSVGATVTVVRPAVSDLSDASNVALLNAANTFSNAGGQNFTATGADQHEFRAAQSNVARLMDTSGDSPYLSWNKNDNTTRYAYIQGTSSAMTIHANGNPFLFGDQTGIAGIVADGGTGSGNGPYFRLRKGGTTYGYLGTHSVVVSGTSNDITLYSAGALEFYANGALAWGINTAGDWMWGGSGSLTITDSVGVPTIGSGGGGSSTIGGRDYAFTITFGSAPSAMSVNFGHDWGTTPVCTGTASVNQTVYITATSSTAVTITENSLTAGDKVYVHCRK